MGLGLTEASVDGTVATPSLLTWLLHVVAGEGVGACQEAEVGQGRAVCTCVLIICVCFVVTFRGHKSYTVVPHLTMLICSSEIAVE